MMDGWRDGGLDEWMDGQVDGYRKLLGCRVCIFCKFMLTVRAHKGVGVKSIYHSFLCCATCVCFIGERVQKCLHLRVLVCVMALL